MSSGNAHPDAVPPSRLRPTWGTGAGLSAGQPVDRFYIGTPCWWCRRRSGWRTGSTVPSPTQGQRGCFSVCASPPERLVRKSRQGRACWWPRLMTDARRNRPDRMGQDSLGTAPRRDPGRTAAGRKERRAVRPIRSGRFHATDRSDRPAGEHTTRRSGRSSTEPPSGQDLSAWAAAVAAALPPLTEPQVAAVARLAADLDANDSQEPAA